MRDEHGQATVEWVGLVLVAALVLGALASLVPVVDGRSLGGLLAHRITCAVRERCDDGDDELQAAYGDGDAALVRAYAPGLVYEPGEPSLPVDYRACRSVRCSRAPDDRGLDTHRTDAGMRATAFTHVLRRDGRTYLQYYLYYPDSNTRWAGSDKIWKRGQGVVGRATGGVYDGPGYPGYHDDDWEGYQVRIDRDGSAAVRATAHGGYQWCKQRRCKDRWGPATGWTRVSSGSHAGHIPLRRDDSRRATDYGVPRFPAHETILGRRIAPVGYAPQLPGRDLHERTSTASGLRLVPLESVDQDDYRPLDDGIKPPWRKTVYTDPESDDS